MRLWLEIMKRIGKVAKKKKEKRKEKCSIVFLEFYVGGA
jgi:hypothetical protein